MSQPTQRVAVRDYQVLIRIDQDLIDATRELTSADITHIIHSAFIWADPEQVSATIMYSGESERTPIPS